MAQPTIIFTFPVLKNQFAGVDALAGQVNVMLAGETFGGEIVTADLLPDWDDTAEAAIVTVRVPDTERLRKLMTPALDGVTLILPE